jgi:hypothetical protein
MLEELTCSVFSECVGNKFRIHPVSGQSLEVELVEALPLPAHAPRGGPPRKREPFSLVFRGPRERLLPQRIYKIEHEKLGVLELFLVPIGPDQEGQRFQAVFN